ncbi:hypothetical protein DRO69_10080 [Candidatus Bathyarchaeota archaeon]|nr:MAG: hypothetical protein DRO69_10080 [Candidatus Bathyarchaeota archaeon]
MKWRRAGWQILLHLFLAFLIVASIILLAFHVEIPSVKAGISTVQLWVDGYDETYNDWSKYGVSPYLDAQDQPDNYIEAKSGSALDGYYTFENLSLSNVEVLNVTLYIYCKTTYSFNPITVYVWNGSDWNSYQVTSVDWNWTAINLEDFLDSVEEVNVAKVYFESDSLYGPYGTYIDAAYLSVDIEAESISLIGESTSEYPIIGMYQRWCFYAKGLFWAFYSNGTHMVYASGNGTSWNSSVAVRPSTNGHYFSIWFDGTYVHYAFANCSAGNSLYYRRGTPHANGTITWQTEQTVLTVSSPMAIHRPTIATDSQGYPWIGYALYNESNYISHPYVIKSSINNGTWVTAEGFPYQLTTENFVGIWSSIVVPLSNGKMAAVYAKHSGTVKVKAWDGSAWRAETNTTNVISMACMLSAVGENDYVHIAFHEDTNYDLVYAKYSFISNSFINETTLEYGMTSTTGPSITIDSGGNLYIFWYGTPNDYVYYRKYDVHNKTWKPRKEWIISQRFKREDYCISFYQSWNGYIGFMFVTGSSSPYKVKFAYFRVIEPSEFGTEGTPQPEATITHYAFWQYFTFDYAEFYWNISGTWQLNGTINWEPNATDVWSNFTRTIPANSSGLKIAWYIVAYDVNGSYGNTPIQVYKVGAFYSLTFDETLGVDIERRVEVSISRTYTLTFSSSTFKSLEIAVAESFNLFISKFERISLALTEILDFAHSTFKNVFKFPFETLAFKDCSSKAFVKVSFQSLGFSEKLLKHMQKFSAETLKLPDKVNFNIYLLLREQIIDKLGIQDLLLKSIKILRIESLGLQDLINKFICKLQAEQTSFLDEQFISVFIVIKEQVIHEFVKIGDRIFKFLVIIKAEPLTLLETATKNIRIFKSDSISLLDQTFKRIGPFFHEKVISETAGFKDLAIIQVWTPWYNDPAEFMKVILFGFCIGLFIYWIAKRL